MTRAIELLKTNFGVSQLYTHDVVKNGAVIFTLAKTLHKTVSEICREMTKEEMIGWASFFELENEEYEKEQQRRQTNNAFRGKRGRMK